MLLIYQSFMLELLFTMALPTVNIIITDGSDPLLFLYDSFCPDEKSGLICIYSLKLNYFYKTVWNVDFLLC